MEMQLTSFNVVRTSKTLKTHLSEVISMHRLSNVRQNKEGRLVRGGFLYCKMVGMLVVSFRV